MTPSKSFDGKSSVNEPSAASQFQNMLDDIKSIFRKADGVVDVDELWRVLESYKSKSSDWSKFAQYDALKYKRVLVDEDENYNIMIIGWGPQIKSCIHDHSGSHCFMKILDGDLIESRFAWPDDKGLDHGSLNAGRKMDLISEARVTENEVVYITDKVGLHRVENPSSTKTSASLHVYIPPLKRCKAFNERTGKAMECKLTFDSKCGKCNKCGKITRDKSNENQNKSWLPE